MRFRFARIEQPRDVWVIEAGEDLAFRPEAQSEGGWRSLVDDLDRDLRRILFIGALAEINRAGAAAAKDVHDPVLANDLSQQPPLALQRGVIRGPADRL